VSAPLCPIVLSMLDARPRRPHEVARELQARGLGPAGSGYAAASETLERLARAGLVRQRPPSGPFAVTRRGRQELRLQRSLWRCITVAERALQAA
jgi:DNA-binding PadR family transcriptional regulator